MGTGLDSFADPQNIGPLYPFAGTEVALAVIGILLWIGWHVRQIMTENREYERATTLYRDVGMVHALQRDSTEFLVEEEELREAAAGPADTASEPPGAPTASAGRPAAGSPTS
jgi:hypothetical protein